MTGPEHYREAERLAARAEQHITEDARDMRIAEVTAYVAQVHATLAVAAATAINDPSPVAEGQPSWAAAEWEKVAYPMPPHGGGGQ
ncbi:hypothetical protein [Micromonospora sp. 4G55]|uniref:hypothetical protein n=1 Tax=Micromonospora sp. 4G55 TaxID=2806102 RepID=UPI001A575F7D|nr:hypothetical protein [Micromonospora sp. 4G55]MBM0256364.1 hypothetical protein [Micromonospora sp. 4G55]